MRDVITIPPETKNAFEPHNLFAVSRIDVLADIPDSFHQLNGGDSMRLEKPKKCLDCLNSKQKNCRVYCHEWGLIVLATHAKICPKFIPRKRRRKRRKRQKEVLQWR